MHFSNRNLSKMPENNLNLLFSILHLTPPRTIPFCQSGIFIASILHHERNPFNKQHLSSFSKCILHINTSMITATLINSAPLYYLLIKCKLFSDLHAILLFFFFDFSKLFDSEEYPLLPSKVPVQQGHWELSSSELLETQYSVLQRWTESWSLNLTVPPAELGERGIVWCLAHGSPILL